MDTQQNQQSQDPKKQDPQEQDSPKKNPTPDTKDPQAPQEQDPQASKPGSQKANQKAPKPKVQDHEVVKKSPYKFNFQSFRMPGSDEIISAEDAATDPDLIKAILAIPGQNVIKEVY